MRIMTLKRNRDNSSEVEVHLELGASLRALALDVFMYLLFMYLGAALMRAYILTHL